MFRKIEKRKRNGSRCWLFLGARRESWADCGLSAGRQWGEAGGSGCAQGRYASEHCGQGSQGIDNRSVWCLSDLSSL